MRCVYCYNDNEFVVPLPIKRKDGSLVSFSCRPCAETSGAYCQKHLSPHSGFIDDNTTACLRCVEEEVNTAKYMPEVIEQIYARIREALSPSEWERLQRAAEITSTISGDTEPESVLRIIVTRAHRQRSSSDEVLAHVLSDRSVLLILPKSQL